VAPRDDCIPYRARVCSTANDKAAVLRNGTKGLYLNPPAATLNIFLEWSKESGTVIVCSLHSAFGALLRRGKTFLRWLSWAGALSPRSGKKPLATLSGSAYHTIFSLIKERTGAGG
jgi:hypothetical protein